MIAVTISTRPCYWIADDAALSACAADALATLLADLCENEFPGVAATFDTADDSPSFAIAGCDSNAVESAFFAWADDNWAAAIEVARDLMAGEAAS